MNSRFDSQDQVDLVVVVKEGEESPRLRNFGGEHDRHGAARQQHARRPSHVSPDLAIKSSHFRSGFDAYVHQYEYVLTKPFN